MTLSDEGLYQVTGNSIDFDPTGSPERMKAGTVSGSSTSAGNGKRLDSATRGRRPALPG